MPGAPFDHTIAQPTCLRPGLLRSLELDWKGNIIVQSTADVVIIGAGVIGCSTAYHLARLGIRNVAVVEMNQIGSGTSSKSASMLSLQFCHDELSVRMAKHTYARYMQFEAEFGVPIDFKKIGWLSVATEASSGELLKNAQLLQSHGIPTEVLTPEEIKRRYPEINTGDIVAGTWGPDDGPFDPHMILTGFSQKARELGVKFYEGVRAVGIRLQGRQVEAAQTTDGDISTPIVVNAAGPWAIEIGKWVNVDVPIVNAARSIVVTGPFSEIPADRPFVEDVSVEWYYRPEGQGILMGMGQTPTDDLDVPFTSANLDEILTAAIHRVPILERATFLTGWTGVRPLSPDNHPILGPVPSVDGFILNCGWGGTGIIQAPIAGQLVAEYMAHGTTTPVDIKHFSLERFAGTTRSMLT